MRVVRSGICIPHVATAWPEGHSTRAKEIRKVIPGLREYYWPAMPPEDIELLFVDTSMYGFDRYLLGTLSKYKANGVKLVYLARMLNSPIEAVDDIFDLTLSPGPYESGLGKVIGPLVLAGYGLGSERDVLVVVSGLSYGVGHWVNIAQQLAKAGLTVGLLHYENIDVPEGVKLIHGYGPELIGRSSVIVGAGGAGTVYETLWSGAPLVVARSFTEEQNGRIRLAKLAGERVFTGELLESVFEALTLDRLPRRSTGHDELIASLEELGL